MTERKWNSDTQRWEYPDAEKRIGEAVELLKAMTDDERLEVFSTFCMHCGREDPKARCQCWNDE